MKTILLFLLISISSFSQNNFFIEFAVDPKMAIQGPYENSKPTLNYEIKAGVETEHYRFGWSYESHKAIEYWKAAFLIDYILRYNNFTSMAGIEFGMIKRGFEDSPDWIQYGFNFGQYYRIPNSILSVGINYNVFRGETAYRQYKNGYFDEFRHDVMLAVKVNL
jgi:hypothetical protein